MGTGKKIQQLLKDIKFVNRVDCWRGIEGMDK